MPSPDKLRREVRSELENLHHTVEGLEELREDLGDAEPAQYHVAGAAHLLGSIYMGIENVLKRISKYHGLDLPSGKNWHVQLFQRFVTPSKKELPALFDENLARRLDSFRRFRHVVHHGYAMDLRWERMQKGFDEARPVVDAFRIRVEAYLGSLEA
jgi:hypothetical protein